MKTFNKITLQIQMVQQLIAQTFTSSMYTGSGSIVSTRMSSLNCTVFFSVFTIEEGGKTPELLTVKWGRNFKSLFLLLQ